MLEKAKELIKRWEGLRLQAYKCPAGVWTIGYGHTKTAQPGQTITPARAEELLEQDITAAHKQAMRVVQVPLTEGQAAALVVLCLMLGRGRLGRAHCCGSLMQGIIVVQQVSLSDGIKLGVKYCRGVRAGQVELVARPAAPVRGVVS